MEGKKIGIVLSGGGARGIAHVGILQALHEHGVFPQYISGSSAGSIVGAFYAAGFEPLEMMGFLKEMKLFRSMRFGWGKRGFFNSEVISTLISRYLPFNTFEELKKELHICITNMNIGEPEYFSSGELPMRIVASCSIPVVFTPVVIDNVVYADGGVLNNFPIEPLENKCDLILGAEVNPIDQTQPITSWRKMGERTYMLAIRLNAKARKERCDWLVEPHDLVYTGIFDTKQFEMIYEMGYNAAIEKIKEIHPLDILKKKEVAL